MTSMNECSFSEMSHQVEWLWYCQSLILSTRKPSIVKLVGAAEKTKKVPSYVTWWKDLYGEGLLDNGMSLV